VVISFIMRYVKFNIYQPGRLRDTHRRNLFPDTQKIILTGVYSASKRSTDNYLENLKLTQSNSVANQFRHKKII